MPKQMPKQFRITHATNELTAAAQSFLNKRSSGARFQRALDKAADRNAALAVYLVNATDDVIPLKVLYKWEGHSRNDTVVIGPAPQPVYESPENREFRLAHLVEAYQSVTQDLQSWLPQNTAAAKILRALKLQQKMVESEQKCTV